MHSEQGCQIFTAVLQKRFFSKNYKFNSKSSKTEIDFSNTLAKCLFLLKYGDDFSMEYSCPHKCITPGFTMGFLCCWYLLQSSFTWLCMQGKGRNGKRLFVIYFFRFSEFSPHVNSGSNISLFQSLILML